MPQAAYNWTNLKPSATGSKFVVIVSYGACNIGSQEGDCHIIDWTMECEVPSMIETAPVE